jgi:hypothetical protein
MAAKNYLSQIYRYVEIKFRKNGEKLYMLDSAATELVSNRGHPPRSKNRFHTNLVTVCEYAFS